MAEVAAAAAPAPPAPADAVDRQVLLVSHKQKGNALLGLLRHCFWEYVSPRWSAGGGTHAHGN